jgi:hypothetical protein
MLVGQFKRAQSELTRGNAYSQKITIAFEKDFELITTLIYMGTMKSLWTPEKNYGWKQL